MTAGQPPRPPGGLHPLRDVVGRQSALEAPFGFACDHMFQFVEELSCGHQNITTMPATPSGKRRCRECPAELAGARVESNLTKAARARAARGRRAKARGAA